MRDVDNEGYHVAMAHPALQDLYGATYFDEPFVKGVSRSFATYNPHAGRRWSVKNYIDIAPEPAHLPEHLRKAWIYYGMFPNMVIAMTPETVQFYQEFPLSTGETLLRGAIYRYRKKAAAGRGALPRLAHRPRHHGRGRAALRMVERIDAVRRFHAASISRTSNMACAPITTICAR